MNGIEACAVVIGARRHLTTEKFDYFRDREKLAPAARSTYAKRAWAYDRLAKKKDPLGRALANVAEDPARWVGDFQDSTYEKWLSVRESLSHTMSEELRSVRVSDFRSELGSIPRVVRLLLQKRISLEVLSTMVDLDQRILSYWRASVADGDPLWLPSLRLLDKYRTFLRYDRDRVEKIILDWSTGTV